MTTPQWSYILPTSLHADTVRAELRTATYLVVERCLAIEGYRLAAFTSLGDVKQYLTHRTEQGHREALVAVTRIDKTVVWPQLGTPMPLEDLFR